MQKWFFAMGLPVCLLAGCLSGSPAQHQALALKRTFVPLAGPARAAAPAPGFETVKVRAFRAMPPFDARTFIVRRKNGEFAADFYNGWLVSPQDLIRAQATRYLEEAKLFKDVYDAGCGTLAPLGLEGVVSELFLDYSCETPAAVVTLRLLVLDERTAAFNVLFTCEKSARVPLDGTPETAASQAFGQALTQTLQALTAELAQAPLPKQKQ